MEEYSEHTMSCLSINLNLEPSMVNKYHNLIVEAILLQFLKEFRVD